jgi:hypothetical protein
VLGTLCWLNFIELHLLCLALNHIKHFVDHAAHARSILKLYGVVDTAQTQSANSVAVRLLGADQTFDLRYFDGLGICFGFCHDLPQNLFNILAALGCDHRW